MEIINKKLNQLNDMWINYIWEIEILKSIVSDKKEVWKNYFADIIIYFEDTLEIIDKKYDINKQNKETILEFIAVMQIIYVQQDLMDEILKMFKLECSKKEDKNPNRQIRNELVGHPISRDRREKLISSSIFGYDIEQEKVCYTKYDLCSESFKYEKIYYDLENIVDTHKKYLNKYLDIIINKIEIEIRKQLKELKDKNKMLVNKKYETKEEFDEFIQSVENYFPLNNLNYINKDILKQCYMKKEEHIRYKYFIEKSIQEIIDTAKEIEKNLEEELNKKIHNDDFREINFKIYNEVISNIKLIGVKNEKKEISFKDNMIYYFEKMYEKKGELGINILKKEFIEDKKVYDELINMENNLSNDSEYYVSLEYIKKLIDYK